MQAAGAYVDQIPPGAHPPPVVVRRPPAGAPRPTSPPPGLYLQVASAASQPEAVRAGLAVTASAGDARPAFIRGVAVTVDGQRRIRLFAGPLRGIDEARALCARVLPEGSPCLTATFGESPPPPKSR